MAAFYKYVRYLAYSLEILVFYVIQRIPNGFPPINNVRPILLLPVAVMIALFEGRKIGTLFAIIIGLFLDCGSSGKIGFYSITLACIGFLVGAIAQKMIKFNFFTSVLISFAFVAIFYLIHFLFVFSFITHSDAIYTLCNHYFFGALYTSVFSPFIYFFNKAFAVNIKESN